MITPATKLTSEYLITLLSIRVAELKIMIDSTSKGIRDSRVANPDLVFAENNKPVTATKIRDMTKME